MKIILAFDSFKESLSSRDAAQAFEAGLKEICPDIQTETVILADGGEGTAEALMKASGGKMVSCRCRGPLGGDVDASYGLMGDGKTAVIETAAAIGLPLVPVEKRNPMKTSSYGAGELITKAHHNGVRRFIISLGGSSTVDGGLGLVQALGFRLFDKENREITEAADGSTPGKLGRITLPEDRYDKCRFVIASDVTSPLLGPDGAAAIYGPQKGATPEMVTQLETGLQNLVEVIERTFHLNIDHIPGMGAAGGMAALLVSALGAEIKSGIDIVLDETGFEKKCAHADWVITGEGKVDSQTLRGKAVSGIMKAANRHGVPVAIAGGKIDCPVETLQKAGIGKIMQITPEGMNLREALDNAAKNMRDAGHRFAGELERQ